MACSGGTGGGPLGGAGGGGLVGGGSALDGGVGGNNAAPEQDSGVVYPQADPEMVVVQIQCTSAKCTYDQPIYGLDGEVANQGDDDDDSGVCIEFKGYLGRYLNGFTPCCNERVVRFVDPILQRYVEYETASLDGLDGGFQPKLPHENATAMKVVLAPEGTVAAALGQWQDCAGSCIPEDWRAFDNPWSHPSCAFMHQPEGSNVLKFQKAFKQEMGIQKGTPSLDSNED